MNTITNNTLAYAKQRPIMIGVFAILAVIVLGAGLAFATGLTNPVKSYADDLGDVSAIDTVAQDGGSSDSYGGGTGLDLSSPDTGNDTNADGSGDSDGGGVDTGIGLGTGVGTGGDVSTPDTGNDTNCCGLPDGPDTTPPTISSPDTGNDTNCCNLPDVPTTVEPPTSPDTGNDTNCCDLPDVPDVTPPTTPPVVTPPGGGGCTGDDCTPTPVCTGVDCTPTPPPSCLPGQTGIYPDCTPTPPKPQPECIALTGTPTTISPGDAVTLAWQTKNATSITIDNGVGSVTPVAAGSTVVHPTSTTTYTATVANAAGNVNCQTTVTVTTTPPPPPGPSCVQLTANQTSITPGQAVVLAWVTSNASSISIDNGIGNVTPVPSGTVTVNPTQTTTYTATVPGAAVSVHCQVTVTVTTTPPGPSCIGNCGGGGGGGGGGGWSGGGVSGQIIQTIAPVASYVSLSQIPYTGLDLGPVGTVVYWVALVVFCATASYLIMFNIIPFFYRRITAFGMNVGHMMNNSAALATATSHSAPAAHGASHAAPAHAPAAPAPVLHSTHAPAPTMNLAQNGFRSFAPAGSALTIDDIVKGLSRESGQPVAEDAVAEDHQLVPVGVAHTNYAPAASAPAYAAPARQTSQQNVVPQNNAPMFTMSTDVRDFVAALLNGDRTTVFSTIRQVVREGGSAEDFLTQVVCALDDAYRARLDGTQVHPEIAALTQNCATAFLERLTISLTNAVDSSYSAGITGAKLAVTRALAVVEG